MTPPYYRSAEGHAALMHWYERALAPLNAERLHVETRIGPTHVIAAGPKADPLPVVLLHGINVNAAVWRPQLAALSPDLRLLAPDVPGYAGQSAPVRLPYDGPALADWLADTLGGLGVRRAVIVGSSAGGYFAMKFAAHYPDMTAGVLLLNPSGLSPYRTPYRITRHPVGERVLNWLGGHLLAHRPIARRMVQGGMRGETPDADNIELAYLLLKHYRRYSPPPVLPDAELRAVTAPVWLIESDPEVYTRTWEVAARLCQTLPNLPRVQVIAGAGHDLNKVRPALVNTAIRAFHADLHPKPAILKTPAQLLE